MIKKEDTKKLRYRAILFTRWLWIVLFMIWGITFDESLAYFISIYLISDNALNFASKYI